MTDPSGSLRKSETESGENHPRIPLEEIATAIALALAFGYVGGFL